MIYQWMAIVLAFLIVGGAGYLIADAYGMAPYSVINVGNATGSGLVTLPDTIGSVNTNYILFGLLGVGILFMLLAFMNPGMIFVQ